MRAVEEIALAELALESEREITHAKLKDVLDSIIEAGHGYDNFNLFQIDFEKDKQRTLDRYIKIFKRGVDGKKV